MYRSRYLGSQPTRAILAMAAMPETTRWEDLELGTPVEDAPPGQRMTSVHGSVINQARVALAAQDMVKYLVRGYYRAEAGYFAALNELTKVAPIFAGRAISFETAGTLSPAIVNESTHATGLIQFLPSTARGLGTSVAELAAMRASDQMRYVDAYFASAARPTSWVGTYTRILSGTARDGGFPLFNKGSDAYAKNSGLDRDNDGIITASEAATSAEEGCSFIVAIMGDSHGVGLTAALQRARSSRVPGDIDTPRISHGGGVCTTGASTSAIRTRGYPPRARADKHSGVSTHPYAGPDLILISAGDNDGGEWRKGEAYAAEVASAVASPTRVIWCPPPRRAREVNTLACYNGNAFAQDGVHLTPDGYSVWLRTLLEYAALSV